jgi:iron complex outermembrane recepter protein
MPVAARAADDKLKMEGVHEAAADDTRLTPVYSFLREFGAHPLRPAPHRAWAGYSNNILRYSSREGRTMTRSKWFLCPPLLVVATAAGNVWAQSSPALAADDQGAQEATLQEVVVTAERRETSAQKSALSLSVINGEDLTAGGIVNTQAMIDRVPGLDITHANINSNISLRGLASGGSTQFSDPVISFNIGGVPLSRQYGTSGALYDLQRVEVLKGPQGTLYGRNATVGAINLIPNRPTHDFDGSVTVDLGNYNSTHLEGVINAPVTDKMAIRLAASTNRHDGYLSNGYDDADNQAARLSLLYDANEDVSLLLWVDYYHDGSKGPGSVFRYVNPGQQWQVPNNPWFSFAPAGCGTPALCPAWSNSAGAPFSAPYSSRSVVGDDGFVHLKQIIYAAELNWTLPFGVLTLLPSHVSTDLDSLSYSTGLTYWPSMSDGQNAFEARLASTGESRWRWVVGALYFHEQIDALQRTLEPTGWQLVSTPDLLDRSLAGFGEVTYSLTSALRVTGGLRYTSERKSEDGFTLLDGAFTAATCPTPGFFVTGATTAYGFQYPAGYCQVPNGGSLTFNNTSWKTGIEYDLTSKSLLYANVRTGFKAGGLAPALPPNTYGPEKLTAYEIGSKNRFLNNRLQANLELFYWDYKNQQISVLHPLTPAGQTSWPVNVPGWVDGAEANIVALVTEDTRFDLDVLYERGKYDIYPTVVNSGGTLGGLTDYPRINMPTWSGTITGERRFALPNSAAIVLSADAHSESGTSLRPVALSALVPGDYRSAFVTGDLSLGYEAPKAKWSVTAYVNNVSNAAIVGTGSSGGVSTGVFYRPPTDPAIARYATLEPPRTFGIRMRAKF